MTARAFWPVHPFYWLSPSPEFVLLRRKWLMKFQRVADKTIQRILNETGRWMLERPADMLLALDEAHRRLQEKAVDDPCFAPVAFAVEYILNDALFRLALLEAEGRITFNMVDTEKSDA